MRAASGSVVARSFKPRRRRLSAQREAEYARALHLFGLAVDGVPLVLADEFGSDGPFVLDVGFGAGEGLLELARARPQECVIGVDVHTTGLAAVLAAVMAEGWTHVRVVDADVLDFLHRIPSGSLDEIRIYFPDPWPKQRQRHRRLVRGDVIEALVDRLRIGGRLHLSTDDAGYSLRMQQVCKADRRLTGGVVPRPPWRPITRYEQRGLDNGRAPTDIIYARQR